MGRGLVETADLTLNRRTLLAAAAGGAAMAIGCGSGSEPTDSAPAAVNGWSPPDDERRRALVATARFGPKQAVRSANGVAICTHPLASAAAADMLALGGNACDGVLAASMAQAVVEPHMTTLSGCLSMLYYDAASGEYTYVNGMMAAPQAVPDVKNMDVAEFGALMTKTDGTLCFVPGFWGGFEAGLERHGLLPRATVMAPAIHYARDGFEIHPFLWGEMFVESAVLGREPFSREIYFNGSTLRDIGDKLVQSALADTLDRLAEEGGDHFYRGEFGRRYAETVQARGGLITAEDMAAYEAFWDEPVQGTYRDYGVVGSPAPDFGGQALVEIMNMVELPRSTRLSGSPLSRASRPAPATGTRHWAWCHLLRRARTTSRWSTPRATSPPCCTRSCRCRSGPASTSTASTPAPPASTSAPVRSSLAAGRTRASARTSSRGTASRSSRLARRACR